MSISVTITGIKEVQNVFDTLLDMMENNTDTYRDIANKAEKTFAVENFARVGRLTELWKPLSKRTRLEKAKLGFSGTGTLVRTGRLKNDTYKKYDKNSAEFGFSAEYAKYHQNGTRRVPKRLLIKATDSFVKDIVEIYGNNLKRKLK